MISPPGAVRNAKHNVVDRVVDGGYIENYGAITAMELAVAINAVRPELAPFVLIISNDPDENPIINKIDVPDAIFLPNVLIPSRPSPAPATAAAGLPCSNSSWSSTRLQNLHAGKTRRISACGRNT